MTKQNGFTLIEIIIVLAITLIASMLIFQTMIALLRGSAKTSAIADVKENGRFALSVMEDNVRNALPTPVCIMPTPGALDSGVQIVLRDSLTTPTPLAQRSVTFACVPIGGKTVVARGEGLPPNFAPLTGNTVQVVPGSCVFSCPATSANIPARVIFKFSLSRYLPGITPRPEDSVSELFTTTVTQRAYENY